MREMRPTSGERSFSKRLIQPILREREKARLDPYRRMKQAVWLYFFLLIFEGALRKWVVPSLSTPILIIRDPVAFWLLAVALKKGVLKINAYIGVAWVIMFFAFSTAITLGHGNVFVAVYGLRIFVLHFPLIFIIGRIFDRDEVIRMGKATLLIAIPMSALIIAQFFSPQTAWVNKGVGDTEGAGYWGALGYFRPPGTFSFTSGLSQFYGLVAPFVFFFWLESSKYVKRWLLIAMTASLLVAIPFSISRTLLFSTEISFLFALVASARNPRYFMRFVFAFVGGAALLLLFSNFDFFQTGIDIFTSRYENSNQDEGGVQNVFMQRFLGSMFGVVLGMDGIPFWGFGLGGGTMVGSVLMTGKAGFLIAEGEWGRLIGEMGFLLGISMIGLRTVLAVKLLLRSIPVMIRKNFLPWMMLSFSFLLILQAQWSPPSGLGFSTLAAGLTIAAFRKRPLFPAQAPVRRNAAA